MRGRRALGKRLPALEAVPLGIDAPAEAPELVVLDALVDLDPCSVEPREHRIEVANGEVHHPLLRPILAG